MENNHIKQTLLVFYCFFLNGMYRENLPDKTFNKAKVFTKNVQKIQHHNLEQRQDWAVKY